LTEELIWRSLIIPLHLLAKISPKTIVFATPLYFGIAHIHHYYEFRLTHPHTPALPAVLRSVFQFTYTSLFGFFAAFVFLRNRNLLALILAHSFCNWMGLPRFWGRVGAEAGHAVQKGRVGRKQDGGISREGAIVADTQESGLGVVWTIAYYVLLVAGALGFYLQLFPLTKSSQALETF
jgi:prenyl protein peptidase